jgi:hypothetical protein
VRDPAATKAEVEAAIEAAHEEFSRAMRYGLFPRKGAVGPDFLLRWQAHHIIERLPDEVMPSSVRDYACSILSEPPKGLKHTYAEDRDVFIVEVIGLVIGRGFLPTRNDATRTKERYGEPVNQSACSIVAKALARIGVRLSERAIEDIWARYVREKEKWTEKSRDSPGKMN